MSASGCVSRLPPWFSRCVSRKLEDDGVAAAAAADDDDDGVAGREAALIAEATLLLTGADVARFTGGKGRGGCRCVSEGEAHLAEENAQDELQQNFNSDLLQRVHLAVDSELLLQQLQVLAFAPLRRGLPDDQFWRQSVPINMSLGHATIIASHKQ
jgi:hypothetical protein